MTIKEASKKLNMSVQSVRVWIQQGDCPFGFIIRKGSSRNTYYINEKMLKKWRKGKYGNLG